MPSHRGGYDVYGKHTVRDNYVGDHMGFFIYKKYNSAQNHIFGGKRLSQQSLKKGTCSMTNNRV